MTAVQSTRDIGEMLGSSTLTALAAAVGYSGGFALALAVTVMALLLAWRLGRGPRSLPTEK